MQSGSIFSSVRRAGLWERERSGWKAGGGVLTFNVIPVLERELKMWCKAFDQLFAYAVGVLEKRKKMTKKGENFDVTVVDVDERLINQWCKKNWFWKKRIFKKGDLKSKWDSYILSFSFHPNDFLFSLQKNKWFST